MDEGAGAPHNAIKDWTDCYEHHVRTPYIGFDSRSAKILWECWGWIGKDVEKWRWICNAFHRQFKHDDWMQEQAFSPAAFKSRCRGLNLRYVREVAEPALAEAKRQARLADQAALAENATVSSLVERIGKR